MTTPRGQPEDRSRRPTKAERRSQILTQARRLFLGQGYQTTTTEQIAEAAGVTPATLRRHFETKEALFVHFLDAVRQATLDRWQNETVHLGDAHARLQAIVSLYLKAATEPKGDFRIIHRLLTEGADEAVRSLVRSYYTDCELLLARIIADGQQSGVFRRSLDPRIGAWELIRSGIGLALTEPLDIPLHDDPDYSTQALECMLHCLLKTDV